MSECDWKQTPTLDEFNAMYDEDDNIWWRIACGHHQNLYEAAVERYQTAEAQVQRVREVCDLWQRRHDSSIRHPADIPAVAITAVLRALGGGDDD